MALESLQQRTGVSVETDSLKNRRCASSIFFKKFETRWEPTPTTCNHGRSCQPRGSGAEPRKVVSRYSRASRLPCDQHENTVTHTKTETLLPLWTAGALAWTTVHSPTHPLKPPPAAQKTHQELAV